MNKITILIIINCAFILTKGNAQFSIGPRFGLNFSSNSSSPFPNHFGCVFNIEKNDIISYQAELLYSQKGNNYLEVPLLAKVSFGRKRVKGFVNLGPYFGYWMSNTYQNNNGTTTTNYNIDESENRLDFGLAIGTGIAIKVGRGNLLAEIRYDLGFINTIKSEFISPFASGMPAPDETANRCFMISIGYLFKLGKK